MNNHGLKVCVVIPIYKNTFSREEELNVKNTINKFSGLKVFFIAPSDINTAYYTRMFNNIAFALFDKDYFKSIKDYNRLMLSKELYERFIEYDYMCICQPDVWIIKKTKDLLIIAEKGFDYYGAPWLKKKYLALLPHVPEKKWTNRLYKFVNFFYRRYPLVVGNGGFSLRKVDSTISLLERWKHQAADWFDNEDTFFSFIGKYKDDSFVLAPLDLAKHFSLETHSRRVITEEGIVPVGVHAYGKWYPNLKNEMGIKNDI